MVHGPSMVHVPSIVHGPWPIHGAWSIHGPCPSSINDHGRECHDVKVEREVLFHNVFGWFLSVFGCLLDGPLCGRLRVHPWSMVHGPSMVHGRCMVHDPSSIHGPWTAGAWMSRGPCFLKCVYEVTMKALGLTCLII